MKLPLRSSAPSAVSGRIMVIGPRTPCFADDESAAAFFEAHDTSLLWEQMKPARSLKLPPDQVHAIRQRFEQRALSQVLGLSGRQVTQTRRIARRKAIPLETQLRRWIAEGIRREANGSHSGAGT